ncbi:MAG TPA: carboxylating nicotinate-nucleotide diphosphorylase [Thermodesulfobacteriota bacterium]
MPQVKLNLDEINHIVENALFEDVGSGDITTNLLFPDDADCKAIILAKEEGVVAGLPIAQMVFKKLDKDILWNEEKRDGDIIKTNQVLAGISGSQKALLTGERVALNFLQRLSGIATLTSRFVEAVHGLPVKILDTRKTVPGLRTLDKYAVMVGGGNNHRFGLYDGVLIKDNHIKLAGGIFRAVTILRDRTVEETRIEVEASTIEEVKEALEAGADVIMLDNMPLNVMREAISLINKKTLVEVSGGVSLDNVRTIAEMGVDFISVGFLTHSPRALDMGFYVVSY